MKIGNKLKELRKQKKLTQEELAKKSELSKNAIWNYENGKRTPSYENLQKICNALQISLPLLLIEQCKLNNGPTDEVKKISNDLLNNIIETRKEFNKIMKQGFHIDNDDIIRDIANLISFLHENHITPLEWKALNNIINSSCELIKLTKKEGSEEE